MEKIRYFLQKDNYVFGAALALTITIVVFAALFVLATLFPETFTNRFLRTQVLALISIFVNLLPFRIYMSTLKFDKTGRGILAAMFILTILYFLFMHESLTITH